MSLSPVGGSGRRGNLSPRLSVRFALCLAALFAAILISSFPFGVSAAAPAARQELQQVAEVAGNQRGYGGASPYGGAFLPAGGAPSGFFDLPFAAESEPLTSGAVDDPAAAAAAAAEQQQKAAEEERLALLRQRPPRMSWRGLKTLLIGFALLGFLAYTGQWKHLRSGYVVSEARFFVTLAAAAAFIFTGVLELANSYYVRVKRRRQFAQLVQVLLETPAAITAALQGVGYAISKRIWAAKTKRRRKADLLKAVQGQALAAEPQGAPAAAK
ncbi:hypothetical protein Efla_006212 [Eimeria flavescens]